MKFLDTTGLVTLWGIIKTAFVTKESGKGLSTNDYTTTEKNKLSGIATGANNYTHPTTNGNKHIPADGAAGNVLTWSSAGTAAWSAPQTTQISEATTTTPGLMSASDKTKVDGIEAQAQKNTVTGVKGSSESTYRTGQISITAANIGLGNVSNTADSAKPISTAMQTALDAKLNVSLKGVANGVAELDSSGKVVTSQLPSYVDDVLEFAYASFPTTGESGKIYVATDTNKTYRWSGTAYVEISSSLALGTTSSTAFAGDKGNTAYTHSQAAHAPTTAQKNSDITKAEIEAKLTGQITSHTHAVEALTKAEIEAVLTGQITSHTHAAPTKAQIEAALTGEITSHTHAIVEPEVLTDAEVAAICV